MTAVGLIVNDPAALSTVDVIVRDLVVGRGHTVTPVGPDVTVATAESSFGFLVATPLSSASVTAIAGRFAASLLPIVVCANSGNQFAAFGFGTGFSQGTNRTWSIYAAAVGDPLAAGYSGDVVAWSGTSTAMANFWPTPSTLPAGAVLVACQNGNTDRPVVTVLPASGSRGWRGGISSAFTNVQDFRTTVWENLFGAQVVKAASLAVPPTPGNAPPTASYAITPAASVTVGTTVTATLSGTDTDGTIASRHHSLSVPPGSTAVLSSSTAASVTFTPDVVGTYTLSGYVVDDDGAQSPTITRTVNAFAVVPPSGTATVSYPVQVDLRGFTGSGGALSYALTFVDGESTPITEVSPGLFTLPAPTVTSHYAYSVSEAGGATANGTVTVNAIGGGGDFEVLEDHYVKVAASPARWAKVGTLVALPGDAGRLWDVNGNEVP